MSQQNSTDNMPNMSFWEHLEELRTRFIRSLGVFMVGFVVCYYFADHLLGVLRKPLFDALPPDVSFTSPTCSRIS